MESKRDDIKVEESLLLDERKGIRKKGGFKGENRIKKLMVFLRENDVDMNLLRWKSVQYTPLSETTGYKTV